MYIFIANRLKVVAASCVLTFISLTTSATGWANPTDGVVAGGSATITAPDANTVQVNQHTDKAIINWQSFNIGTNQTTRFVQPSARSIAVNRVNPNNGSSKIAGRIIANGQIWVLNPAGILITPTARIDAAGFLATTADISDRDFMDGNYRFVQSQDWNGSVINEGTISISDSGIAALVAPAVSNSGVIQADLGQVVLASGKEFVVDFYGDELIHFTVNSQNTQAGVDQHGNTMEDAVSNSGEIIANGGKVVMAANTAADIVHNNINMSGTIVAKTASMKNGVIVLSGGGGKVKVTGKLIASGERAGEKGGKIKIEGKKIIVADNAKLDVTGRNGGGEILIGGDAHGAGPGMRADYAYFGKDVVADASALTQGDGGKVVLWSDIATGYYGNIYARGGAEGGNGGFVETSGKMYLESGGMVNASATYGLAGEWLLDPYNITIANATANGSFSGGDPNVFTPSANTATVDVATINASLNGGTSVTIDTGGTGSPGAQAGDLTLTSAILKNAGATTPTLTLNAAGTLALNNNITATSGGLNVVLTGSTITIGSTANSTITTLGGNFTGTAQNAFSVGSGVRVGVINTGSGTVTIVANADGASTQSFAMTSTSSIATTNTTSNAVNITVNTGAGGTGTATLAGITTGSGGTVTVNTSTNGEDIIFAGTSPINVGTGTVSLTTGLLAGRFIGTSAANVLISAGTLNATTGTSSIFVTNSGTGALSLGTINTTGSLTLTSTSSSSIAQSGIFTVTGTSTFVAGGTQDISLTNSANNTGTLVITSGNNVSFTDTNAIILGASTISGNFDLTAGGTVTETGALAITGTPTFTLTAALSDISLATQANNFATTPVITNNGNVRDLLLRNTNAGALVPTLPTGLRALTLTYNNATSLVLPGMTLTGSLSVTSNGAITQSGAIIANVSGTTQTFAAGAANNITLNNASNDLRNVLITNANNVSLTTGTALIMGASAISGTFSLTTGGAVTTNGAVTVTGLTTLASGSGNSITLNNAANDFSTVQIDSGNAVTLRDANSIILGTSTTAGALSVTSNGAITQSGVITSPNGTSTFTAGAANNITLDTFANNFGTVGFTTGNDVKLSDTNGVILTTSTLGGILNVTAGGTISQSGVLTITGTPTFTVTAALSDISLATSANVFSTTPVITNNGNVRDFLLRNTSAGAVVPSLPTGLRNLTLTYNNATSLALPSFSITGSLSATANGPITQTGALTVPGTATLAAGVANNITLTNASNDFGTVTITNGNNVDITDANALIMSGAISGTLGVITSGALTQSAVITVTGLATLNANSNNITWNTSTNNFSSIRVTSGNNVNLRDTNAMIIDGITANGTLTLQTNGAMTQTAAITATGSTSLTAGAANDITLTNTGNNFSTVTVASGNNVAITDSNDITFGTTTVSGTFNATAGSHITQTGVLTITGTPTFTVTSPNSDILLASAANAFTTTPVFTNNGNIRDLSLRRTGAGVALPTFPTGMRNLTLIYNNATVTMPAVTLTGALSITAGDTISQSGTLVGATLTLKTLNNAGASITLNDSSNDFTSVDLRARNAADSANAAGAILYRDTNGFDVALIGSSSTVNLIGGGAITQTSTITGSSLTAKTLNNSGAAITFTNTGNVVPIVDLRSRNSADTANADGVISFSNSTTFDVATILTTSIANLTSLLNITQSGAITAGSLVAKTLRNAGGSINLNNSGNNVATIDIRARNLADTANAAGAITYVSSGDVDVATIGTTSTVNLTASGMITDSGSITGTTLTTSSVGGTFLTFGHAVTGFTATNSGSGNILLTATSAGTLTLNAITESGGTLVGIENIGGITAAGVINTNNADLTLNSISGAIAVGNAGVLNAGLGNITLTASGTITDTTTGNITGNQLFAKTLNNAGSDIVLDSSSHTVNAVNLQVRNAADTANADGIIDFRAASGFDVQAANTTNTVTLRGTGVLTQSGSMTGTTLTAITLNNAGADITFNNGGNEFTNITLQSRNAANTANTSGTINYQDATGINFTGLSTSGNASIIANGVIADSGVLVVGGTLAVTSTGGITLNSVSSINAINVTNNSSGIISISANSIPLFVEGLSQNNNGSVTISNASGISVSTGATFMSNGGSLTLTATAGDLSVSNGVTINSNGGLIAISANDLNLNSSGALNSGSGIMTITQNIANGTLVLGNGVGSMTISNTELGNITANNLTLLASSNGQIQVDGVTAAANNNISSLTLTATTGTTGSILFQNNASEFKALSITADNVISLGANLTTTIGDMTFGGAAGTNLVANVTLTAPGIIFNTQVDGAQDLTLNADSSANITFNGNVGNTTPLNSITILNANNISVNNFIHTNTFTQNAGAGTTAFNTQGIITTGNTSIITNNVTGEINVNSLSLGTNLADLTGTIAGGSGTAAIQTVVFLNTITAGTHFFNGIDMFTETAPPTPPTPPPIPGSDEGLAQIALPDGISSFYKATANIFSPEGLITLTSQMSESNKACKVTPTSVEICKR